MLAAQPNAMQLRYFNALSDIATDKTSTIVFPLPIDVLPMKKPESRKEPKPE